jgi:nicotinamide mononucleotide (NMN) deamidase PncC
MARSEDPAQLFQQCNHREFPFTHARSVLQAPLAHLLAEARGATDTLHGGVVVCTKDNKVTAVGVVGLVFVAAASSSNT